ncbi:LON peptidase N-terminal domain and RING finger protein 2 isoform X2 [Rhynchophorus ferrugineus]|uniref:LON peptidase N-terminal domain and RING finger protein 2 isoform X2 n=1 Tax=Rhynchophorus ferrugineus TaxID=354439 RepID=UPI003FCC59F5
MDQEYQKSLDCSNTENIAPQKQKRRAERVRIRPYQKKSQARQIAFNCVSDDEFGVLLRCSACANVLECPVTVQCGHTVCSGCLVDSLRQCPRCLVTWTEPTPNVNVLVKRIVERWRERNKTTKTESVGKTVCKWITMEDFECLLCNRYLFVSVTTDCGHTFCRDCLTRVLDHRLACPLCRSSLSSYEYFKGTTELLNSILQSLLPEENQSQIEKSPTDNIEKCVPVFVCTNAFPGVACPLEVHEARYRLLVRRCLQSSIKRFAMVGKDKSSARMVQYGTILEVKDAVTLEDGRIILASLGIKRFKIIIRGEEDGYDTAEIETIKDIPPLPEKLQELEALHQKVHNNAVSWVKTLSHRVLSEIEQLIGTIPTVEDDWIHLPDGPRWTWWLMSIFPFPAQLQVGFLKSASLEKRLRAINKALQRINIKTKINEN